MILQEHCFVESGAFVFFFGLECIAIALQLFILPKSKRSLFLEKIKAVLSKSLALCLILVAEIVVNNLVKFLLQLESIGIDLLHVYLSLLFAKVLINIDVSVVTIFALNW
jgi:hypothetical protein